jgi:hypothetical protein
MALTGTQQPSDKSYANLMKAANLLDPLFAKMPDHPGLAHYIIHAYDVPALAPRALEAARAYAKIAPDAPHALHMPSHTFTRLVLDDRSRTERTAAAAARKAKSPAMNCADDLVAFLQSGRDAGGEEGSGRGRCKEHPRRARAGNCHTAGGRCGAMRSPRCRRVMRWRLGDAAALTFRAPRHPGMTFCPRTRLRPSGDL